MPVGVEGLLVYVVYRTLIALCSATAALYHQHKAKYRL